MRAAADDAKLFSVEISDAGAIELAAALLGVPLLSKLFLGGNQIGYAGATALAAALKGVPLLADLDVGSNQITNAGEAEYLLQI